MGYAITENIFNLREKSKVEFFNSTCQALILLDEEDIRRPFLTHEFMDKFEMLHKNTTDAFAFFLASFPPEGYEQWEHKRTGFKADQYVRETTSTQRRNLNLDLARCLGLSLQDLPAVVISPALWGKGHYLVIRSLRSADEIEQVIEQADAVSRVLDISQDEEYRFQLIKAAFIEAHPDYAEISGEGLSRNASSLTRTRMANIVSLSEEGVVPVNAIRSIPAFKEHLRRLGSRQQYSEDRHHFLDELNVDLLLAGTPVFSSNTHLDALDTTSRQIYDTALSLYEDMKGWSQGDFTPAASGFWKTVEREFGLTVIQVLRAAKGVKMPDCYGTHDPTMDDIKIDVPEITNPRARLNRSLKSDKTRIELPTLGNTRFIFKWGVEEGLLPINIDDIKSLVDQFQKLTKIRNEGSHLESLSQDYAQQAKEISQQLLEVLLEIKTSAGFPPKDRQQESRRFSYPTLESLRIDPELNRRTNFRDKAIANRREQEKDFELIIRMLLPNDPNVLSKMDDAELQRVEKEVLRRLSRIGIDIQKLLLKQSTTHDHHFLKRYIHEMNNN